MAFFAYHGFKYFRVNFWSKFSSWISSIFGGLFDSSRVKKIESLEFKTSGILEVNITDYKCITPDCKTLRNIVSLNCNHCSFCQQCFDEYVLRCQKDNGRVTCPVCKVNIAKYVQIYVCNSEVLSPLKVISEDKASKTVKFDVDQPMEIELQEDEEVKSAEAVQGGE